MQRLARFAVRQRWIVVGVWLAVIIGVNFASQAAGGATYKNDFKLPHTEAETVARLLTSAGLDKQNGAGGTVVFHVTSGKLADRAATIQPVLAALCGPASNGIASITSPWGSVTCGAAGASAPSARPTAGEKAAQAALLSSEGTIGIAQLHFDKPQVLLPAAESIQKATDKLKSPTQQVELTGDAFQMLGQGAQKGIPPEVFGIVAALFILALVFRTVLATLLPLVSAAAAAGTGLAAIALLSHVMSVADFATQLATLMILGCGIDYALFIVTRHRKNLLNGMSVEDSVSVALNTSGRAVMFAGITVCIAILGLCALQVSFLYGVAVGTAIGVLFTMIASLTLMPALLGFIGLKVLTRKQRRALQGHTVDLSEKHGMWYRWSHVIERRPILPAIGALAILVMLAIPFFGIRLGSSDQGNDPSTTTTRKGYDLVAQGFGPGYNGGLELVVSGPKAADQAFLKTVTQTLAAQPGVVGASIHAQPLPGGKLTFVGFTPTTSPQDQRTTDMVKHLRSSALPPIVSGGQTHVYVYGVTAIQVDFAKVLQAKMPIFFLAVIGLSFLLLMVAFRSIVIPLTAATMNLLAAAASFGLIVAIFQWGWGSELLGIGKGGPIEPFIPVMFFAILFGLSMDYQVFLVSRMHEEWTRTHDNKRAITTGQGETGGIITAAAIIMIAVFSGFILGDNRIIKLFGIGLGGAIFIDAFILRTVLVPSLMHLIGSANWAYPKFLEKITPQISLESADTEHAEDELVLRR
jgi:putative drug exporter of the RND superfamily